MPNEYAPVTQYTASTTGEFLAQKNPIFNTTWKNGITEFNSNAVYAPGDTVNISIPVYPTITEGLAVTAQDITSRNVPYTLSENDICSAAYNINLYDEMFKIAGGRKSLTDAQRGAINANYVVPAYSALSGHLEAKIATKLKTSVYLTPDDDPDNLVAFDSFASVSRGAKFMDAKKFQRVERYGMCNLDDGYNVANSLQNSFQPALNKKITQTALISNGRLAGFDMWQSADIHAHVAGEQFAINPNVTVDATTAIQNGATQLTLNVGGTSTNRLFKAGDRISIPGISLIDEETKNVLDYKLVVTVKSDANGNGSGKCTITLSEPLVAVGSAATISRLPANNEPCKIYPSRKSSYFYVPSGIVANPFGLGDIEGAANSSSSVSDGQIPVKTIIQGSGANLTNLFRISIFVATVVLPPYVIERISPYNG